MLLLQQGNINQFYLTLTANINNVSPQQYYLMTFNSSFSAGNSFSVIPNVITTNARYTEMQLDCTQTTPNPLLGQCNFLTGGQWTYILYIISSQSLSANIVETLLTDNCFVENCSAGTQVFNFITGP